MRGPIRSVLVVGGGTAGWMTASLLARRLPDLEVTLVESSDIPAVGVGEATIIHMTELLRDLGLGEREWMRGCNATYKEGIRFRGFHSRGAEYWHPFEPLRPELTDFWVHRHHAEGLSPDSYFELCFTTPVLNRENRIDVRNKVNFDRIRKVAYSYHLDAGRFGRFLAQRIATPAGVRHVVDDVTGVALAEDGSVDRVSTGAHGDLRADLYVDCTGFRSLLLGRTLGEPFVDYRDLLPNDRAIAVRMPYEDRDREMHPYTMATALGAGWVWTIPLWSRLGTGYVYSSRYASPEAAEAELRRHLGEERVRDLPFHHIEMRIGRHRRAWSRNVVAIGLSAGFIEPLESTGIELIQVGADFLVLYLETHRTASGVVRALYNKKMELIYDEIVDYIALHYVLTDREDTPYWHDLKYADRPLRDDLLAALLRYESSFAHRPEGHVFLDTAWCSLLVGFRRIPTPGNLRRLDPQSIPAANAFMDERLREARRFATPVIGEWRNPSHHEFLAEHVHGPPP